MNKYEKIGLEFIKKYYDPDAYGIGGFNAAAPDIISPKYGKGEIKYYKAQAGQFTESTIKDNTLSALIASKPRKEVTSEEARAWCREHYKLKNIKFVVVVYDDHCEWFSFEDFFKSYNFSIELRERKKSGSNPLSQKYWNQIPEELSLIDGFNSSKNKVKICLDKTLWNYKYNFKVIFDDGTIRDAGVNSNGMIYTKSCTNNITWIFQLGDKNDKIN